MSWLGRLRLPGIGDDVHLTSPESRVGAYIDHWYRQWTVSRDRVGSDGDLGYWGRLVDEVDTRHFRDGTRSTSACSLCDTPLHDPGSEIIINTHVGKRLARIDTACTTASGDAQYHVYRLRCEDSGNWLITDVVHYPKPPDALLFEPERHATILALADTDIELRTGPDDIALSEKSLFREGLAVGVPGFGRHALKLVHPGRLTLASGVIGIVDLDRLDAEPQPLDRRVPPGEYPVEVAVVNDIVAGIRVRFDDTREATRWFAAKTSAGQCVYGEDAGSLAIVDMQSLLGLSCLGKDTLLGDWSRTAVPAVLTMGETPDCAISRCGLGDGAYPAYWGVSDDGHIVSLFLDYGVAISGRSAQPNSAS